VTLIKVEKMDEAFVRIFTDKSTEQELSDFFTFPVPGAKFMPKFKAKIWDGKARLYNLQTKKLYAGLIEYVKEFASRNDYELEIADDIEYDMGITTKQVEGFAKVINPCSKGNPIEIRDYQVDAIHKALNNCRTVLLSPTASGKSLIIYTLLRWFLAKGLTCIIIVPTTSLVEQLYSDFEDYSTGNGWSTVNNCQKLYSGLSKDFTSNVLITTWQSTFKLSKDWCNQFDVVFSDECHLAKASSLTGMFENMTDVKYRIGTTGTIDNSQVNQLQLEGIMGPVHRVITTRQLMDSNRVVQLDIKCLLLKYPEELRKIYSGMKYQEEMDFLVSHEGRNKFITNLALKQDGNTLVLFQFVAKHGKILHKMIQDRLGDGRKLFFVSGEVNAEEREYIRKECENETNAIIVASFGTFSTGVNIPSIENIIFSSPTKSKIRNLQSIGRGLRLREGKSSCILYDIADDLSWKSSKNHTLSHFAERVKTYTEEQFDLKLHQVDLK
jgi:superfamily II DNA or RNA helicase